MLKNKLLDLFGAETYEAEYEELETKYNDLQEILSKCKKECESQKRINDSLAADFVRLEEDLKLLRTDPEQYIELEVERRMLAFEKQHEDEMNHKWYGIGRMDAYAEMGIKVIEAHERGNDIVIENGEVIEQISEEQLRDLVGNEITIDDLVDV